MAEEDYIVDHIIDKRIRNGKTEYYLGWKGYGSKGNTWEPQKNLNCPKFEKKFKAKIEKKDANGSPSIGSPNYNASPASRKEAKKLKALNPEKDSEPRGFDRSLQAERLIGATGTSGELILIIKWKGSDEMDPVPARQANLKCPNLVI
nr:chromobox protein homolog 1-like [Lepeophtheirus salmonis]